MAGMIEYAVEHGMMEKTALNAMSRKGYRQLDLAHRMIGQAEKGLESSGAGARAKQLAKNRLADLRTDYLHPTRHSILGDMKGSKRLYKPFHDYDRVDPGLARRSAGRAGRAIGMINDVLRDRDKAIASGRDRFSEEVTGATRAGIDNIIKTVIRPSKVKGDAALYAPDFSRVGIYVPSASRQHHAPTFRKDTALNDLSKQLNKSRRLVRRSAARIRG